MGANKQARASRTRTVENRKSEKLSLNKGLTAGNFSSAEICGCVLKGLWNKYAALFGISKLDYAACFSHDCSGEIHHNMEWIVLH